ncbi:ABC transporter ATP-binding protein [Ferrimonas pelagia]|uniref:ABC transporter transmembrane domain-containing protein n=1 Tax=Ferrimonas pelagia TaxID=1177826 RepID=A0ABP9FBQ6_9GAMM
MGLLWNLRHYIRPYAGRYLLAFVLLQVVAALNLLPPWLIGRIVDAISENTLTGTQLAQHLGAIVAAAFAMYGLRYGWQTLLYGSAIKISAQLRSDLFAHFTRQSPAFYHRHSSGDLMAHATNDLKAVEQAAGGGIMVMVDSLVAGFTVLFGMVFVVSGELSLVALLPYPLLVWFTHMYGGALHSRFATAQGRFSGLTEEVRETVSSIRAVRAHGIGARQQQRFNEQIDDTFSANMSVARIDGLFWPTIQVLYGFSFVLALLYGAYMISLGEITVGLLTSFTLYLAQLLGPLLQFGWQFNIFQRGAASWERLQNILRQQPEINDGEHTLAAGAFGEIHFHLPAFHYPAAAKGTDNETDSVQSTAAPQTVLRDIDLRVQQGQFIGITGPTGGGKSTLMNLLQRHYPLPGNAVPNGADITLGGQSVSQYTLASLRQRIAWVPQQSQLFSGTIAANISFARPHATQAQIEQAAELAGIHDEIVAFEQGYQTVLGENGINVSGGQKQRLNLARALLSCLVGEPGGEHSRDNGAYILLLDDAFSALDMKTEAKILDHLREHFHRHSDKTVILITQRLPALAEADQIWVLDEGQVVEQGSHAELMAHSALQGGWYRKIFTQQNRLAGDKEATQ